MDAQGQNRGRGRPRDPEKDTAIREAAWQILAEKGYEAFSFEAVADLAGCSRSTLYRRFAGKAELIEAALGETARVFEPETSGAMAPRDVLIAHVIALRSYMADVRGPAMMRISLSLPHQAELAAVMERHLNREQHFYFREFARIRPQGLADDIRDFAFYTLIGSVTFHVALRRVPPSDAQIAQLVDYAISLIEV